MVTSEIDAGNAAAALQLARDFVENTGVSIFLTGKAGTGKTTFLRNIVESTTKTCVVVAPTGVAAINAGGVTIHSFFQLSLAPYVPGAEIEDRYNVARRKLRIIRALDLLIIDEISMVRADLLDAIDNALRKYRRNSSPFGGVQLLMIGDLHQLAPVVTPADEAILRGHYDTPYFFGSKALASIKYITLSLEHVFRQQDRAFVDLLNNVRENKLTAGDVAMLQSRLNPEFVPHDGDGYIRLTTHNSQADQYNEKQMSRLKSPAQTYCAQVTGTFPESSYPTAEQLTLKIGAQVMFLKNDTSPEHEYYNGLIGVITEIDDDDLTVQTADGTEITVLPQEWENVRYTINEKSGSVETEVVGTFRQMPLRPAWAITIHKSQGLTFDKVVIDAGASFAPGQVYVALSRCRTLQGIVLATPISAMSLRSDESVNRYMDVATQIGNEAVTHIDDIKLDYHRKLLCDLFDFGPILANADALKRLIYTSFRSSYPEIAGEMERVEAETRSKLYDVSEKWRQQINAMPTNMLTDSAFLERVQRSAVYFRDATALIYGKIFKSLTEIQSDNKQATERGSVLAQDLRRDVSVITACLSSVADNGFSVGGYLKSRQDANLRVSSALRIKANSPKEEKEKKEKKPKGETYMVTLRLFREGMSREEIAKSRNLKAKTINNHLLRHINNGEIAIEDVIDAGILKRIYDVLDQLPEPLDYSIARDLLPGVQTLDIVLANKVRKGS